MEREKEAWEITSGLSANPTKPRWALLTLHGPERISSTGLEAVSKPGHRSAQLATCPGEKWLKCVYLSWPAWENQCWKQGGRCQWESLGQGQKQNPVFGFRVCAHLPCSAPDLAHLESLFHVEICVCRVLTDEGWLAQCYYSLTDGWVEEACRIQPFICSIL